MPRPVEAIRTLSLRAHLLLLVIGTTLPVLLVAAFLVRRVVADDRQAIERRLLEAARAEAAIVDAELAGSIRALQGLGQSDRLTDGQIDAFYKQAQRLIATQPIWAAINLFTADGRQLALTSQPLGDALPAVTDRESFDRAVQTRTPAIGNLRRGQVTHQLGFVVRVPVVRDDVVLYVLSTWITSDSFAQVLRRQSAVTDDWIRGVVDAAGLVVARSREPERFVGTQAQPAFLQRRIADREAVFRDRNRDGAAVYGAFAKAPMSGWTAAVAVPASVVDSSLRQSMIALGVISLLLIGFGGGGTFVISRRISTDISKSAAEAEAVAGGRDPSPTTSRVTEVQRFLDALQRSAALLRTRERERDEQLARADAARAEAEAADRAKDDFLAMLGHELRNPLAPALTAIHLMKLKGPADAVRERDVIERQIRHMARLVDDLLDVSRLRRGAIELRRERFDIADAIASATEMTGPLFQRRRHRLDVNVESGLFVDADRIRLAQVLSNLLTNAAKYTESGGRIALRAIRDGDHVAIECRDNGIGIPADLLPRVFNLFVQGGRGSDRREGGLGLGLAVARTLVELHGGTLEASSDGPDRGSVFCVRLPLAAAPKFAGWTDAAREPTRPRQLAIGPVMIVDDNRDALDMLVRALQQQGIEAVGASAPSEALDLVARVHPRIAVLDIGLPEMDGFALARALRSAVNGNSIVLIALTGYGREQDVVAARAAGFNAFFVKPVEIPVFVDALHRFAEDERS
jgi:signal transduction histidine kinase/CheY-like chemotaxis protein